MARLWLPGQHRQDVTDTRRSIAARSIRRAGPLAVGAVVALAAGLFGLQAASASGPPSAPAPTPSPASIGVALPLHPAPFGPPPNLVLTPNATWHSSTGYSDWESGGCGVFGGPLSALTSDWAGNLGFPETAVGYLHYHDGGICWSWKDLYDRGAVQFDWDQVNSYVQAHGFKSATLSYIADTFNEPASNLGCIGQITEDSTDLNSWNFSSGPIPAGQSLTAAPAVSG